MSDSSGSGAFSPPARSLRHARVERIIDHTDDTRALFLRTDVGAPLSFLPGQFVSISIPLADETRTRAYSIASNPSDESIEICFNRVPEGRGVAWLFARRVGDSVEFIGPFGTFTMARAPDLETIVIAEGTAIAPIRPMLHSVVGHPHAPIFLLYAARDHAHILYSGELDQIAARDHDFAFETISGFNSARDLYGRLYNETERRWVSGDANRTRHFYICGVGKGVTRIRDLLRGSGYDRRAVHYEQW